jgi:ferredoxin
MRIELDEQRCEGHAVCVALAPELFQLDDSGELILEYDVSDDVPGNLAPAGSEAVSSCPVQALRIVVENSG